MAQRPLRLVPGTRVVFLDVDGVSNSDHYRLSARRREIKQQLSATRGPDETPTQKYLRKNLYKFDPVLVARLEEVLVATDARIVMSSTWRYYHSLPRLELLLRSAGAPSARVIDRTPTSSELTGPYAAYAGPAIPRIEVVSAMGYPRGYEIDQWLLTYGDKIESYVILDDDNDITSKDPRRAEQIRRRHVRTSTLRGLSPADVRQAISILETPLSHVQGTS